MNSPEFSLPPLTIGAWSLFGLLAVSAACCVGASQPGREASERPPGASPGPRAGPAERPPTAGAVAASLSVRCGSPTHPISPLIYGIGMQPTHDAPASHQWALGATARRWGGNHTSRYNWELGNAWSTGKDWFFKNVDYDRAARPAHERFIDDDLAHGMATAITVPTLGWVARDTTSYGFPVSIHGPQQAVAPENADAGNGVGARGKLIAPGPPERTSAPMPPASVGRWVRSMRAGDARRGRRGVQMYILDNEPTLWHSTHRDVHPQPLSYDELLERSIAYATEIRRADPDALIAGPALWGWPALFRSGVDQAAQPAHPDRDRHEGLALLPWWLREIAAHERHTGERLLDLVDTHFYPQGRGLGVGEAGDTDPDTAARRLRSTRSLWDPGYNDESWIDEKMRVIPRVRAWIDEQHPGLGVSIGEWNFGAEGHMSGGLAVAEALGRFGEQGVASAFYWDFPKNQSPAYWGFRAFRDFDGQGGHFLEESVQATSDDPRLSIFASRDAKAGRLVLVLLDLDPSRPMSARLDASSCGLIKGGRRLVYQGGAAGFVAADLDPAARVELPPYSMTVLDLSVAP